MKSRIIARLALSTAVLLASACSTLSQLIHHEHPTPVDTDVFYSVVFSGLTDPVRTAIRDEGAWRSYWQRIEGDRAAWETAPKPDFSKDMLVLAAAGTKPTTGYSLRVLDAKKTSQEITVTVVELTPGARCVVAASTTAPVIVVKLARSDLPVRFVEQTQRLDCQ